ncbi:MAG: HAD-IB family hydrolase [Gammaproteobacteria bacterium]|nr:HAD-IB family hydrolase [Gammaproteobacteria bacterium]
MALVFFDLDQTLLDGDSDYEWGLYLVSIGKVDSVVYEKENERFYREYLAGKLDIHEYLRFALRPLANNPYAKLCQWRDHFIDTRIKPMIKAKAHDLIQQHRDSGDRLAIITSTNRFIIEPAKDLLQIETLIATEPARSHGEFTGEIEGQPCFGTGKVTLAEHWAESTSQTLDGSYFYSDSRNDLPLLERVDHPVAVDADKELTAHAIKKNWERLSLK